MLVKNAVFMNVHRDEFCSLGRQNQVMTHEVGSQAVSNGEVQMMRGC